VIILPTSPDMLGQREKAIDQQDVLGLGLHKPSGRIMWTPGHAG